ncbi:MAG: nucleotide exchange factor GrpE [Chloroflexota bacterium]|nr:nucleotide exchange factor GrpE [Chloroflexota bacterium]
MNDKTNGAPSANGNPEQAEASSAAKRGGTRAEERIAALDSSGASLSEQVEQLGVELEAAEIRAAEAEAGWQRARADFANLKRRTEEERAEWANIAGDRLLIRVLDLADDFDLAVEHVPAEAKGSPWVEGIGAIDRKLRALLEAEGIKAMEAEGLPFDPRTQTAISYEDTADVPDGTVIKVLQRGFIIRDRILRPALVAVARNDETTTNDD